MTRQSKRNILEELLTRLAVIEAKIDYLVKVKTIQTPEKNLDNPYLESAKRLKELGEVIKEYPDIYKGTQCRWPTEDSNIWKTTPVNPKEAVKVDFNFPTGTFELHKSLEDRFGGSIEINTAIIGDATIDTRTQAEAITDAYFNGKDWVERPEDLSYIQKFYKEKEVE